MTDSNRVDNGQFFEMDSICVMSEGELVSIRKLQSDLAAANARIAELEEELETASADWYSAKAHYEAANARIAELERSVLMSDAGRDSAFDLIVEAHNERDAAFNALDAANARADAAERRADDATKLVEHTRELHNICDRGLVAAWAERDQLAARVCTPEERAVLGAWGLLSDSALEHLRVNGSIPLSNIAVAELANRAAKAKVIK
jgi:hypothetical protein